MHEDRMVPKARSPRCGASYAHVKFLDKSPNKAIRKLRCGLQQQYRRKSVGHEEISAAFSRIYREDDWTDGSGPGSRSENTIEYRSFVSRFLETNDIRSVTDLGCGDWQSSRFIDWSGIQYLGLDVVETVINKNRERYSMPSIKFEMSRGPDSLPGGDLLLCKDVFQHLPNVVISQYLTEIKRRYKFALVTDAIEPRSDSNRDIDAGDARPIRLNEAPFFAEGAYVAQHFPVSPLNAFIWRKGTFLMFGGS